MKGAKAKGIRGCKGYRGCRRRRGGELVNSDGWLRKELTRN